MGGRILSYAQAKELDKLSSGGTLGSAEHVLAIAEALREFGLDNVIAALSGITSGIDPGEVTTPPVGVDPLDGLPPPPTPGGGGGGGGTGGGGGGGTTTTEPKKDTLFDKGCCKQISEELLAIAGAATDPDDHNQIITLQTVFVGECQTKSKLFPNTQVVLSKQYDLIGAQPAKYTMTTTARAMVMAYIGGQNEIKKCG